MFNEMINDILPLMSIDWNKNIRVIREKIEKINYIDNDNQSLLHIFLSKKHNENQMILAIKTLLEHGNIDLNLKDNFGYNFIQTAIDTGYSENFILELINISISNNRKLDVNTTDCNGNTIVHTAINSDNFVDEVINIYVLLCNNGFNSFKKNHYNENLIDTIKGEINKKYTKEQVQKFIKVFNYKTESIFDEELEETIEKTNFPTNKEIRDIEELGKILNFINFSTYPTIGREEEIDKIIVTLASYKESPLLIGDSGVGKSVLAYELAYRIINDQVPSFLKNRMIIETCPSDLIAGTKYQGTFEEKIKELMKFCIKYNAILFIDDIYRVYGTGSTTNNRNDFASILNSYLKTMGVEQNPLKVIGTATIEEYNNFFGKSSLKDKFNIIKITEPDKETLHTIIEKTILDYDYKTGIASDYILKDNKVINTIIEATSKKRVYNDKTNNPKLAISIIDMAFAYARRENAKNLKVEHFIKSLKFQTRIYPSVIENAINKLTNDIQENKNKSRVLKIDFNNK